MTGKGVKEGTLWEEAQSNLFQLINQQLWSIADFFVCLFNGKKERESFRIVILLQE